jgi:uronate dehydrogenase
MSELILLTGAAGGVAGLLRPALRAAGYRVRLTDRARIKDLGPNETFRRARLESPRQMRRVCEGVSAILHLGAVAVDRGWDELIDSNITGMVTLLEAARTQAVGRLVFASSLHVLGMHPRTVHIDEASPLAPDSRYAATKAFGEAACQLFAAKYDVSATVLRIGHVVEAMDLAAPGMGLLAQDFCRLALLALAQTDPGYRLWHAVAPHDGDRLSDGRLEREHDFTYAHPGPDPQVVRATLAATPSLRDLGRRLRGGHFAQKP